MEQLSNSFARSVDGQRSRLLQTASIRDTECGDAPAVQNFRVSLALKARLYSSASSHLLMVWRETSENTNDMHGTLQQLRTETRSLHLERTKHYDGLFRALNKIESVAKRAMLNNEADPAKLSSDDINFLTTGISNLSIKCKTFGAEHKVQASLSYDQRPARLEAIPEAHCQTFSWVFSEPNGDGSSELVKWLKSGIGVFRVTGKPGSGKSTLMKYITEHGQTQNTLAAWAA